MLLCDYVHGWYPLLSSNPINYLFFLNIVADWDSRQFLTCSSPFKTLKDCGVVQYVMDHSYFNNFFYPLGVKEVGKPEGC